MKKHSLFQKAAAIGLLLVITSIAAFAAFTSITPIVLLDNHNIITAGQLTVTLTACDAANGNQYVYSGRDILLLQNTDASPHPITVNTIADPFGGTNSSLTAYSLPANSISAIQMKYSQGWLQTGGVIQIASGCSALIKIGILQYN
jgi:hypothetical protein